MTTHSISLARKFNIYHKELALARYDMYYFI
jgi:hypothetical protein